MNKLNNLSPQAKASIIYSFASFFSKGISIITLPLFTRLMTSAEIGVVTTFTSWQTIISVFATLSLGTGSFSIAMLEFEKERDRYESSILTLSTISSVIVLSIYILFSDYFSELLGLNRVLITVMLISFVFTPAMDYWLARQRYEYNYKKTAIVSLSSTLLTTLATILCVVLVKYNCDAELGSVRVLSMSCVQILFGLFFYFSIMHHGKTFINKKYWSFALKVNMPLMIHALAKHILDVSDRIMISSMVGNSAVGIYGTLYSISSLSLIVWTAMNASLIPYMFEKMKANQNAAINHIINPIFFIYAVVAFLLTLMSPEIVHILATAEYYEAIYMMPAVAAGIFLTAVYNVFGNVLLYLKKTVFIMCSTIVAAIVNILLNYFLIPKYGYIVAAYTTLLAYIILAILQYSFVKIVMKEKIFNAKYITAISVMSIVLMLSCNFLYKTTIVRYIILALVILSLFVFRKKIIQLLKSLKKKDI